MRNAEELDSSEIWVCFSEACYHISKIDARARRESAILCWNTRVCRERRTGHFGAGDRPTMEGLRQIARSSLPAEVHIEDEDVVRVVLVRRGGCKNMISFDARSIVVCMIEGRSHLLYGGARISTSPSIWIRNVHQAKGMYPTRRKWPRPR